jgi:purine-binding chemotaxis protein CheW
MTIVAPNEYGEEATAHRVRLLLEARAERLKAQLASRVDEASLMVAQFRLGDDSYAIPLVDFRAAVPLKLVTPVPHARPDVVGIFRYQRQIIAAISLALLLGVRGRRTDPAVLLVVEPVEGKLIGLDCEEIPRPCPLPLARIEQARKSSGGPVVEVADPGGGAPIHLLDLAALLEKRERRRHVG